MSAMTDPKPLGVSPQEAREARVFVADYTNWKGERRTRRLIPIGVRFGTTKYHPEPQWLLECWDCEEPPDRIAKDFALSGFIAQQSAAQQSEGDAIERDKWPHDYCPECGSAQSDKLGGKHFQCSDCGQEYFTTTDYSDVVQGNLLRLFKAAKPAALSAPQPEAAPMAAQGGEDAALRDKLRHLADFWKRLASNSTGDPNACERRLAAIDACADELRDILAAKEPK